MDISEAAFHAPAVLRLLCYTAGMGVFLAGMTWLGRLALGYGNTLGLRATVILWFMRILGAYAFLSLLSMLIFPETAGGLMRLLPELAILLLSFALWLITRRRPFGWRDVLTRQLPLEVLKTSGVLVFALAGWAVSFASGWLVFQLVDFAGGGVMESILIIGLMWNAPIIFLFRHGARAGRVGTLKLQHVLWPVLLAYTLLLLPDYSEHLVNSPKIHAMMNAKPSLQRI